MILAVVGEPFDAVVTGAPTGLLGLLSVEVYNRDDPGAPAVAPATTDGITESRAGTYVARFTIAEAGSFAVRWTYTDPDVGPREVEEDVVVLGVALAPVQVIAGNAITATLAAPLTLANLGARVEVPDTRAIVAAWRMAAYNVATGAWTVALDPVATVGDYNLVWRTDDPEPPEFEVFVPLSVMAPEVVVPVGGDFAPTVQEVADVTPAYTRGGFDDEDGLQAGAPHATYDDGTSPTADQVQGLINAAVEEVQGRVGVPIPTASLGLARRCVVWLAAANIAGTKLPAQADEVGSEYRLYITNYTACLTELQAQARAPIGMRLT